MNKGMRNGLKFIGITGTLLATAYGALLGIRALGSDVWTRVDGGEIVITKLDYPWRHIRYHYHQGGETRLDIKDIDLCGNVNVSGKMTTFFDNEGDGVVDRIQTNEFMAGRDRGDLSYSRGDPHVSELFKKVDQKWDAYRKELNVEQIINQEEQRQKRIRASRSQKPEQRFKFK